MAKRGTLDHPKTLSLARALKVEAWSALGLLEALWHWTGRYRPTGNITGITPRNLADGIRARRNPQKLLDALIQERWIDQVGDFLYIHDWPDHADDATKKSLERSARKFDPYYGTVSRLRCDTESRQCPDIVATESASRARMQGGKARQGLDVVKGKVQEGGGFAPDWDRFQREYPGQIKPDRDCQVFLSVIKAQNDEDTLYENLPAWKESQQWLSGKIESAKNFLWDGQWRVKPVDQSSTALVVEKLCKQMNIT